MIYDIKTDRVLVVDTAGNLIKVLAKHAVVDGKRTPVEFKLKTGWRYATEADVAKVDAANKARDAKEAADKVKADAKARADQDAKDKAEKAVGGVLA